ncbi:MAG: stage II sporulation protein M [Planctomycetota bacterium]
MNIAKLLEKRRVQWDELEALCGVMELRGRTKSSVRGEHRGAAGVTRFATLYRSACADLALADAYQLPPATVQYLHRLVARAHNQLYRSRRFQYERLAHTLFTAAPRQIFNDGCVRIAAIIFFGLFALSMVVARNEAMYPGFAESVAGTETLEQMEDMYEKPVHGSLDHYVVMAAFYINHNTGIGLVCFGLGILIIPTLFKLAFNAVFLGTIFGYMGRDDVASGDNFLHFVTAHGPFELTAIVLSAAAGLKLGVGFFRTRGLRRLDSLRVAALDAVPVISASVVLFVLAAFTEGFISPSPLPYLFKAGWAVFSSGLISFYFVVLGFPREELSALLAPAE